MGIIARQSIRNTVITYLGTGLGYINVVLLFPYFLTTAQFGLVQVFLAISALFAQIGSFGIPQSTVRYFPYFRNYKKHHHGFLFFMLLIAMSGYLLFALLLYVFRDHIFQLFHADSQLLTAHYLLLFPLALSFVLYHFTFAYSKALFKSVAPVFVREVGLRLYILALLLLYTTGVMHFKVFLVLFVFGYTLQVVVMLIYLLWLKQLFIRPTLRWKQLGRTKEILVYGCYTVLNNTSTYAVTHLDTLMVGTMLTLSDVAVYKVAYFIGMVINIPARGMRQIAIPLIASSWEKNDLQNIDSIYKKTSLTLFITGALIFIGIWANIDIIFKIFPSDKGYSGGKFVFLFIGIAMLINMLGGVSKGVILTSRYFRFNLLSSIVLVILIVLTNLWLIPIYGITGAGIATLASLFVYNLINVLFIKLKLGLLPFRTDILKALLISACCFLLGICMPTLSPLLWADLLLRSALIFCIFSTLILYFNVSEDATRLWRQLLQFIKDLSVK